MLAAIRVVAPTAHDRRAAVVRRLRRRPDRCRTTIPRRSRAALATRHADVEYAQAAYRVHTMFVPERSAVQHDAVEPADDQPGAGLGHPAAGRLDDHRRGARHAAWRIGAPRSPRTLPAFSVTVTAIYPALGNVTIPFAARRSARQRRGAEPRSSRRATSSGTTTTPLDFDGHGTHVSGTIGQLTNDNIGHRRRRVQRQADAGEGDRRRLGRPLRLAECRHRRHRRARHPVRGGQRREGHQHEHRADRVRRRPSSRTRSAMPSARAPSSPSPPATSSRRATRCQVIAEICLAGRRRGVGRGGRSQQGTRLLFDARPVGRDLPRRAAIGSAASAASTASSPADVRLRLHRHVPAAAVAVSGRRGSTSSGTSAMRARRWRRRTSPASRRC